jgi:hypothetical protein
VLPVLVLVLVLVLVRSRVSCLLLSVPLTLLP